jgi:hypothetical protein
MEVSMKFTALSAAVVLALSGALIAGCDRDASKSASGGGTSASGTSSPSGASGSSGTVAPTPKQSETPKKPSSPASPSGSK